MKKIKLAIDDISPGMKLGQTVLEGRSMVLAEGMVLTESLIAGLKSRGIKALTISNVAEELEQYYQVEENYRFQERYKETVSTVRKAFDSVRFFREVPIAKMSELAQTDVSLMVDSVGVINRLFMVRRQDDYTFYHSINVAVICGVLGKWLGYKGKMLTDLILAGLLHDVGKSLIPLNILNKPGRLLEEEMAVMRMHTVYGLDLIKEIPDLTPQILEGVVQHHERLDGKGYPFKLSAEKIAEFGRIIAVADIYDALTSDRVYHKKTTPFAVVEVLVREMFDALDPRICAVFLNNVRDYFLGNWVLLSNGEQAEVIFLSQYFGSRPVVKTRDNQFIDLERRKDISIVKLVEE